MSDKSETLLDPPEVAIKGVDALPNARPIIDKYLEIRYKDGSGQPIVRRSRLEGSIYCAVLKDPSITSRFLQDHFEQCDVNSSSRNAPSSQPFIQCLIDYLIAQHDKLSSTLSAVTADIAMLASANDRLSNAMLKVFTLQASLTTAFQMISLAKDNPTRAVFQMQVDEITAQLNTAKRELQHRADELVSMPFRSTPPNTEGSVSVFRKSFNEDDERDIKPCR